MTLTNIRWSYFWTPTACGTEILYSRDGIPSCTRVAYELTSFESITRFISLLP